MPIIDAFTPPGHVEDLTPANRSAWSNFIGEYFVRSKKGDPTSNDGPRGQFFHPVEEEIAGPLVTKVITWTAFPKQVQLASLGDVQRWRRADADRDVQDEYCEWSVRRDDQGAIHAIDFTSEGPEYWRALSILQPDTLIELYRALVSVRVRREDLFVGDRYNPRNRWNNHTRGGIAHLIQPNNTLGAEIELAAGASIVRVRGGAAVEETQALIRCSRYGQAERHSDPHIGAEVNALARAGHRVSAADPVGLFIVGCDFSGFTMPTSNVAPADCWTVVRGTEDRAVRVRFAPPDGESFAVSDIAVDGRAIDYAGQIADKMTIGLAAWASADTGYRVDVNGCRGSQAGLVQADAGPELRFDDVAEDRSRI
ncbi:MAG: hypothetical protein RLP09_25030 [Sandaracinaceae bacterium]